MPQFKFQLQAVLKQRAAVERTRQLAVAAVEQERFAAEEELRACQRNIDREKREMRDMLAPGQGPVDLRSVRMQAGASLAMIGQASRGVYALAGVIKRLEVARSDLLRAATARKAVETLRERRYEAWLEEQKARESATLDEMAVIRAARVRIAENAAQNEAQDADEPTDHASENAA